MFDNHFQVVSRLRDIPFYELNRPTSARSANPPFKNLDWSHGNLLFDYLRYDRVPNGPGDLDNFQSSRRTLMIMGLINYPELGEAADKIEEELDYFSRRHPNIILRRLFVFNFAFDVPVGMAPPVPPPGLKDDPNSLIIFPPDGFIENGDGTVISMVDAHLKEVMSHSTVKIITSLEKQMEICEEHRQRNTISTYIPLSTIYDDIGSKDLLSGLAGNPKDPNSIRNAYKKKPHGRAHKWMGDLSMQVYVYAYMYSICFGSVFSIAIYAFARM